MIKKTLKLFAFNYISYLLKESDGATKARHSEREPSTYTLLMTDIASGDDGVITTTTSTSTSTTAAVCTIIICGTTYIYLF